MKRAQGDKKQKNKQNNNPKKYNLAKKIKFFIWLALLSNILLFILKLLGGYISNSISLTSDSINSLTDALASLAVVILVSFSTKKADNDHPFGHRRAEPLAGMVVAIIAGVLGFEVIKEAVLSFFKETFIVLNPIIYSIVIFSIILKLVLFFIFKKASKDCLSTSLKALSKDAINDVLVSSCVLFSFIMYSLNLKIIDKIIAIGIGLWIIKTGIEIALENIDYLIGKKPNEKIMNLIKKTALNVKGVKGINDVLAHYVGPFVHVEIHIELDKKLKVQKAHDIGKEVEKKLEALDIIDHSFIHIDPYDHK